VTADSIITLLKTVDTHHVCHSITYLDNDRFLVDTYDSSPPLFMVDVDGEEHFEEDFECVGLNDDTSIEGLAFNPTTKMVLLTDSTASRVHMYTVDTEACKTLSDIRFMSPEGICFAPGGHIFVCDRISESVIQLSPHGDIVMVHDVGMSGPRAISVSRDGQYMAVSNNYIFYNEMVKLFEIVYT